MFKSRLNLINVAVVCLAAIVFSGCDTSYNYIFRVANQTGDQVRVEAVRYNNRDEIFTIPTGETLTIFQEMSMTADSKYVPEDRYRDVDGRGNLPPIKSLKSMSGILYFPIVCDYVSIGIIQPKNCEGRTRS